MKQFMKSIPALIVLMHIAYGATGQYNLLRTRQMILRESGSSGKKNIRPEDIGDGIPLKPGDFLTAVTPETVIIMTTPKGEGYCTLPVGMRMRVTEIAISSMFHYSKRSILDILWDALCYHDDVKAKRTEYGGTRVGIKEASYNNSNDRLSRQTEVKMKKLNDSLESRGVRDSLVYYIKEALLLEDEKNLAVARKHYKLALAYSLKTDQDTALVRMLNIQFKERTSILNNQNKKESNKSNDDDFFR